MPSSETMRSTGPLTGRCSDSFMWTLNLETPVFARESTVIINHVKVHMWIHVRLIFFNVCNNIMGVFMCVSMCVSVCMSMWVCVCVCVCVCVKEGDQMCMIVSCVCSLCECVWVCEGRKMRWVHVRVWTRHQHNMSKWIIFLIFPSHVSTGMQQLPPPKRYHQCNSIASQLGVLNDCECGIYSHGFTNKS